MLIPKRKRIALLLVSLFCFGFLFIFLTREPKIQFAGHDIQCNPKAKIDMKKNYHLRIWDYQWPVKEGEAKYSAYLEKALADFRKIYPNIKVEVTLLDLLTGPSQLENAILSNNAPDVYCSAGEVPPFSFKHQIPVGLYLKQSEQEIYLPNIYRLLCIENTLCEFPRWISPGFWIGNETFLREAGLPVEEIQKNGWTWEEFTAFATKIPNGKYVLTGNLGANGFFTQLMANASRRESSDQETLTPNSMEIDETIDFLGNLIKLNKVPTDCETNMLSRFLRGQALIIAGVKTGLLHFIEEQLGAHHIDWRPVLIPVPVAHSGRDMLMSENSVICIYRNRHTAGADHLTAAVRLGQFLSCYTQNRPWERMMVVPGAKNVFENWLITNKNNVEILQVISEKRLGKTWFPVSEYFTKIYPIVDQMINRKLSAEEAKQRLRY